MGFDNGSKGSLGGGFAVSDASVCRRGLRRGVGECCSVVIADKYHKLHTKTDTNEQYWQNR